MQEHWISAVQSSGFAEAIDRWLDGSARRRDALLDGPRPPDAALIAELEDTIEELRLAQEALRAQQDEITAIAAEQERQRRRYQELFDRAPDAYFVTDGQGVILRANRAAVTLLRASAPYVEGRPFIVFIPPEDKTAFLARLGRLREVERVVDWEVMLLPRAGEPVPVSISASVAQAGGGATEIRWLARDLRDARRADEANRQLRWESALREASEASHTRALFLESAGRALARCVSLSDVAATVPRLAVPMLGDYCLLDWVDRDGSIQRLGEAHSSLRRGSIVSERTSDRSRPGEAVLRVIARGRCEMVDGPPPDRPEVAPKRDGGPSPAGSEIIVPLRRRGRTLGALTFGHSAGVGTMTDPLPLAESFAESAALAIDHALMFEGAGDARRNAEEADDRRATFLAALSHDIRTPLSTCLGYLELMLDGIPEPLPEGLEAHARAMHASIQYQIRLVEDILELARVEAGQETTQLDEIDITELAADVAGVMAHQARDHGLEFDIALPQSKLAAVTDGRRLKQVLTHLLSNAIGFTHEGRVRLALEVHGDSAVFAVSDTGVGIPPDELDHIFDQYWRGASSGRVTGTGLGLNIVRHSVALLGGEIQVSSEVGKGSTFTVRLPVRPPRANVGEGNERWRRRADGLDAAVYADRGRAAPVPNDHVG
jgi:PAS domain S-box-containing protein